MKPLSLIATAAPLIASTAAQQASAQECKNCTTQEVFQAIEELCAQGKTPVTVTAPFNAEAKMTNNVYAAGVITQGPYRSPIPTDSTRASGGLSELLLAGDQEIPAGSLPINGEGKERIMFTLQPDEKLVFDPEQRHIADSLGIDLDPMDERTLDDGRKLVVYKLEDIHNSAPTRIPYINDETQRRDMRSGIGLVGIMAYENGFDKPATSSHEIAIRTYLLRPEVRIVQDETLIDQLETDLNRERVRGDSLLTDNKKLAKMIATKENCDCEPEATDDGTGPTQPDTTRSGPGQTRLSIGYSPRFAQGHIYQFTGADEVRIDESGLALIGGIAGLEQVRDNRYINLSAAASTGEFTQEDLQTGWTSLSGNITLIRGNGFAIGIDAGLDYNRLEVGGEAEDQTNIYSQRWLTVGAGYHERNITALAGITGFTDEIDFEHLEDQQLRELGLGGILRIETPSGYRINASGIYVPDMEHGTTELDTWRAELSAGKGPIDIGLQMLHYDRHFQNGNEQGAMEYRYSDGINNVTDSEQKLDIIRPYLKLTVPIGGSDADNRE